MAYRTVRLGNLPPKTSATEVVDIVKSLLTKIEENSFKSQKTIIAPCCSDGGVTSTALIFFAAGLPAFLESLNADKATSYQVEVGDLYLSFDIHFRGLTALYECDAKSDIAADIVAVHGLAGHSFGSWRAHGPQGRMWLLDFLRTDLPDCRVLLYGYDADLTSTGTHDIVDYTRDFLEELRKARSSRLELERPVIFLGHSFGGLIIARALIKARLASPKQHGAAYSLFLATYAILFFGTPHRGLAVDDMTAMLEQSKSMNRKVLLEEIDGKSRELKRHLEDFVNLTEDIKVVSFYELHQTRKLKWDGIRWSRKGDFITMVDQDASLLQLPDHLEFKYGVNTDHSNMVKFSSQQDPAYQTALRKLREFAEQAPADISSRLNDILAVGLEDHRRVALWGIGGVGKTQVALEFAYRLRGQLSVFWVYSSSRTHFLENYRNIAKSAKLQLTEDDGEALLQVKSWLENDIKTDWLLVIDSLDNIEDATGAVSQDLPLQVNLAGIVAFLPQGQHGKIIITSRDRRVAIHLTDPGQDISVEVMDQEEAVELFSGKSLPTSKGDRKLVNGILEELDYLPLAISQAAAYMRENQQISLATYATLLRESESHQQRLLDAEFPDLRRHPEKSNAVLRTWITSFHRIRQRSSAASDALFAMSFLNRQSIPAALVVTIANSKHYDQLKWIEAFTTLKSYGMIYATPQADEYTIHRLVQLSTRRWLSSDHYKVWRETVLGSLCAEFPRERNKINPLSRSYLPHAQSIITFYDENDESVELSHLLYNISWFFFSEGRYTAAEESSRHALSIRSKKFSIEHQLTLEAMTVTAMILHFNGKPDEAEQLSRESFAGHGKLLGLNCRQSLYCMSILAMVLNGRGKLEESENLARGALYGRETLLGNEDEDTLISLHALARVLRGRGKFDEAEHFNSRSLKGSEKVLGVKHPETLFALYLHALILHDQAKFKGARHYAKSSWQGRSDVLGSQHPETLNSLAIYSFALYMTGDEDTGYELAVTTYNQLNEVLGPLNPSTIWLQSHLGLIEAERGHPEKAERMLNSAIQSGGKISGISHPSTLMSTFHLAKLLQRTMRFKQAETLYKVAFEGFFTQWGKSHPQTIEIANCQRGCVTISHKVSRQGTALSDGTLVESEPEIE